MKSILMSIRPRHVANILNGLKTKEIRKRFPKDYRGWVYIYCTKDKELLHKNCANIYWLEDKDFQKKNKRFGIETQPYLNGKVVARFYCDNVDVHHILHNEKILPFNENVEEKLVQLCLTKEDVMNYGNGEDYYAKLIHISKLEIFDTPKEFSEFMKISKKAIFPKNKYILTRPPQSWCYIETE